MSERFISIFNVFFFLQYLLYKSFGINLAMEDPPEEDRRSILNEVWKVVMKLKNTTVSPSYQQQ